MSVAQKNTPRTDLDVTPWLREKTRFMTGMLVVAGCALILLGCCVCYLTYYGLCYGLDQLNETHVVDLEGKSLGWSLRTVRIAAGLIVALLFVVYHLIAERFTEEFVIDLGQGPFIKVAVAQYTDYGWTKMFEGWDFVLFLLRVVSAVLFLGPQTISAGLRQFQRAAHLLTLDLAGCGRLLGFIAGWDEKTPFRVLRTKLPELDLKTILSQVSYIDGVVFRKSDPPGISLAAHTRDEIRAWITQEEGNATPP